MACEAIAKVILHVLGDSVRVLQSFAAHVVPVGLSAAFGLSRDIAGHFPNLKIRFLLQFCCETLLKVFGKINLLLNFCI
jgi:hypothetical protein